MSVTFYAFWNGSEVADLFHAVAGITSTSNYTFLLVCAVLLGFLFVMMQSALKNRGMEAVTWSLSVVVIAYLLFIPKVSVIVHDVSAKSDQVVDGVPMGLGWSVSMLSKVSYWMTTEFEAAFQEPDTTHFTQFGMSLPQRTIKALMAAGPITAQGQDSLKNFIEHCVVPEILSSSVKRHEVLTSPNLWKTVSAAQWVNPARRVMIDETLTTCPQAVGAIETYLTNEELPKMERLLATQLALPENALQNGMLSRVVPGATEIMLGTSQTLTDTLKHTVMLSALPNAFSSYTANNQSPMGVAITIAKAQGNLSSEINYRTLGEMAQDALPKIRNLLEFIMIGLFPIVGVMMVMSGSGLGILRAYYTILLSTALWPPITAVINYLMVHVDAQPMNRLCAEYGGMTLEAIDLIREVGASSQAMAGSLLWIVPVLAYAIAKGSDMAITSMSSSLLSPAQSAAQAQGSSLAMGNINAGNASVDNTSINNRSGNRQDMSSAYTGSDMHVTSNAAGLIRRETSSGTVTAMSVNQSQLGVDMGSSRSRAYGSTDQWSSSAQTNVNHGYTMTDSQGMTRNTSYATRASISTEGANMQSQQQTYSSGQESFMGSSTGRSESHNYGSNGISSDTIATGGNIAMSAMLRTGKTTEDLIKRPSSAGSIPSMFSSPDESLGPLDIPTPAGSNFASGSGGHATPSSISEPQTPAHIDKFLGGSGNFGIRTSASGTHSETVGTNVVASQADNSGERISSKNSTADTTSFSQSMRSQNMSTSDSSRGQVFNDSATKQQSFVAANNTARTQGAQSNSTWGEQASVNNSPMALSMALQQSQGSAIDALWDLNQNQSSREALARQANSNFQLPDNLGNLGAGAQQVSQQQGAQQFANFEGKISSNHLPEVNTQRSELGKFSPQVQTPTYSPSERAARQLDSGIIKAAQTYFKYEQTGLMSSIDRGLFGANIHYSSPDVMANDLKNRAKNNPELSNFLRENAFNSGLSDEEYFNQLGKFYK